MSSDDDLSKWKVEEWIEVPHQAWQSQRVKVQAVDPDEDDIEIFLMDHDRKTSVLVSLDDAENFATLILYEVKRAKGEL